MTDTELGLLIAYVVGFVVSVVISGLNLSDYWKHPEHPGRARWSRWLLATPVWPVMVVTYLIKGIIVLIKAAGFKASWSKDNQEGFIR